MPSLLPGPGCRTAQLQEVGRELDQLAPSGADQHAGLCPQAKPALPVSSAAHPGPHTRPRAPPSTQCRLRVLIPGNGHLFLIWKGTDFHSPVGRCGIRGARSPSGSARWTRPQAPSHLLFRQFSGKHHFPVCIEQEARRIGGEPAFHTLTPNSFYQFVVPTLSPPRKQRVIKMQSRTSLLRTPGPVIGTVINQALGGGSCGAPAPQKGTAKGSLGTLPKGGAWRVSGNGRWSRSSAGLASLASATPRVGRHRCRVKSRQRFHFQVAAAPGLRQEWGRQEAQRGPK